MDFGNLLKNPALLTGLVRAVILVAVALGLTLTPEQEAVIIGVVSLVISGATAFLTVGKAQVVEVKLDSKDVGLYAKKPD